MLQANAPDSAQLVERYFTRIGYRGEAKPDAATLAAIIARHTETIAFENLTPLTGAPVVLDPDALSDKLVGQRRGGYCFEQNLLLCDVLEHLGFSFSGLAARVVWNRPEPVHTAPRTHMLVRVELPEGSFLVDTGFGGLTLTGVLRLETDLEQATPHEPFRLVRVDTDGDPEAATAAPGAEGELLLQARLNGDWRPLYQFSLQPQQRIDYELASWYVSTHPDSLFVNHLLAGRPTPDRRFGLLDNQLTVHHLDGPSERRALSSAAEIEAVLERDFLLDVSGISGLRARLERFC